MEYLRKIRDADETSFTESVLLLLQLLQSFIANYKINQIRIIEKNSELTMIVILNLIIIVTNRRDTSF